MAAPFIGHALAAAASETGVRYSDDGVDSYGCTRQTPPPGGGGVKYIC